MNEAVKPIHKLGRAGLELAMFLGSLLLAWRLGWQVKDLVWSLWISSLVVGYGIILTQLYYGARADRRKRGWSKALGGMLFGLLFFSVHFGIFHYGQGTFLNDEFPVAPDQDNWPLVAIPELLEKYWLFIVAAFAVRWEAFRPNAKKSFDPGPAYLNVVRMHILIFALAFINPVSAQPWLLYIVVYGIFFFPFSMFQRGGNRSGQRRPQRQARKTPK